jgi:nucleotide-binding universal stress UspA family protein
MGNDLQDITITAAEVLDLDARIETESNLLAALTKRRDLLVGSIIPDLMFGAQLSELVLVNGKKVVIKDDLRASIRTLTTIGKIKDAAECRAALAKRKRAIEWLRENGLDGLLKTDVEVHLGKGQEEAANLAYNALEEIGLEPVMTQEVHAGTLSAALRELASQGIDLDFDLLNASLIRKAVIS